MTKQVSSINENDGHGSKMQLKTLKKIYFTKENTKVFDKYQDMKKSMVRSWITTMQCEACESQAFKEEPHVKRLIRPWIWLHCGVDHHPGCISFSLSPPHYNRDNLKDALQ